MTDPAALPSLDQLARNPTKLADLSLEVVEALLVRCHTLERALFTRLLAARADGHAGPPEEDRLLTAAEAAEDWLHRHARELPFTVRSSGSALRGSPATPANNKGQEARHEG
jgi:hypothetical protein